ncbi:alanine racemase [Longirhabdus pacifica]|uniref:alanine racemase n=1 Tax=Longirhabdus pacifica TaxID=2305227 RepID=UPI001F0C56E1|nr:alanine racemase [Longirhabdus pacifica]
MNYYRPTRVEVSLDALQHNYEAFQSYLTKKMNIMAVLKADAYGHGAVEIGRELERLGVPYLAVAMLDEALELRFAGIHVPILVMGYTSPEHMHLASLHDITVTIYDQRMLDEIADMSFSKKLKVHMKLETGMGRLGVNAEDAIPFIEVALHMPHLEIEGLFTHFAAADEADKQYTYWQYDRFNLVVDRLQDMGITFKYVHTGNSPAAIDTPGLSYNMVRIGISLYGLYPSEEVEKQRVLLQPVMSIKTNVIMNKMLPPDYGVSYGVTYRTKGEEQIATIPIGYADGFTRMLTHKVHVLVKGKRVPVVGRICMDQCMVNVTGIDGVDTGEEVVLIGEQQGQRIAAEEWADLLGTINYEIPCMISSRVPRIYVRNDEVLSASNSLLQKVVQK